MSKPIQLRFYRLVVVALLLLNCSFLLQCNLLSRRIDRYKLEAELIKQESVLKQARTIIRAVDGDTLVLDGNEKVRIIGINAPETYRIKNPDPRGVQAKEFIQSLVGKKVLLTYEKRRNDPYGRTLAHVYVINQKFDIGRELLKRGLVETMFIEPNINRKGEYLRLVSTIEKHNIH